MKRFFAIIFMILMLTACSAEKTQSKKEPVSAEVPQEQTGQVQEKTPAEADTEQEVAHEAVPFTTELVEGLVEDTVGYSFEIPVFEVPGYEAMRPYYDNLVLDMENFTKNVVHENALERSCIVSVYGKVVTAVMIDDVLSVTYAYECQYSDVDEPEVETRVDRFDPVTGELVEG